MIKKKFAWFLCSADVVSEHSCRWAANFVNVREHLPCNNRVVNVREHLPCNNRVVNVREHFQCHNREIATNQSEGTE